MIASGGTGAYFQRHTIGGLILDLRLDQISVIRLRLGLVGHLKELGPDARLSSCPDIMQGRPTLAVIEPIIASHSDGLNGPI